MTEVEGIHRPSIVGFQLKLGVGLVLERIWAATVGSQDEGGRTLLRLAARPRRVAEPWRVLGSLGTQTLLPDLPCLYKRKKKEKKKIKIQIRFLSLILIKSVVNTEPPL